MAWALPLASLALAAGALVISAYFSSRSMSRSASADYVGQLEHRIAECERDRAALRGEVRELRREIGLLREQEHRLLTRLLEEGR